MPNDVRFTTAAALRRSRPCQLVERRSVSGHSMRSRIKWRRYADDPAPSAESPIASSAMCGCGNAMASKLKEIVNAAVSGKKTLRMAS